MTGESLKVGVERDGALLPHARQLEANIVDATAMISALMALASRGRPRDPRRAAGRRGPTSASARASGTCPQAAPRDARFAARSCSRCSSFPFPDPRRRAQPVPPRRRPRIADGRQPDLRRAARRAARPMNEARGVRARRLGTPLPGQRGRRRDLSVRAARSGAAGRSSGSCTRSPTTRPPPHRLVRRAPRGQRRRVAALRAEGSAPRPDQTGPGRARFRRPNTCGDS